MKPKSAIKLVIDAVMTLGLLFLMGYQFWGRSAHELTGVGIFLLFITHNILNFSWYRALFHGKYTPMRVFRLCINMLTLAAMLALMCSSVVISRYVFRFLNISGGMSLARRLHILGSYWGIVLMSLHLGLHWSMLLGMVKKRIPAAGHKALLSSACFIAGLAVAAYGAYVFVSRDYPAHLFLQIEFVFLDYSEPKALFYLDQLSLMGLFIFLSHYLSKYLRKLSIRKKGKLHCDIEVQ